MGRGTPYDACGNDVGATPVAKSANLPLPDVTHSRVTAASWRTMESGRIAMSGSGTSRLASLLHTRGGPLHRVRGAQIKAATAGFRLFHPARRVPHPGLSRLDPVREVIDPESSRLDPAFKVFSAECRVFPAELKVFLAECRVLQAVVRVKNLSRGVFDPDGRLSNPSRRRFNPSNRVPEPSRRLDLPGGRVRESFDGLDRHQTVISGSYNSTILE